MNLEAYLFFPGTTEEAMTFYRDCLGGTLNVTHRGDVDPTAPDDMKHLVINASLDCGDFTLRASDRSDATGEVQTRIELTIVGTNETELRGVFDALAQGGSVKAPLERMFWGDIFGGLIDRFGIGWQVNIAAAATGTSE